MLLNPDCVDAVDLAEVDIEDPENVGPVLILVNGPADDG